MSRWREIPDDCGVIGDLDALERYITSGQAERDWCAQLRNGQELLDDIDRALPPVPPVRERLRDVVRRVLRRQGEE